MGKTYKVLDLISALEVALQLTEDAKVAVKRGGDILGILCVLSDNLKESLEDAK